MSDIQVGGSLIPGSVDTPLDARTRINAIGGVPEIRLPYIGMVFYVTATGKRYVVKSLKSRQIGQIVVENAQIDQYEELTGGTAARPARLLLVRPAHARPLRPEVSAYPDSTLTDADKIVVFDDATGNAAYWSGESWRAVSADGIPVVCENLPVEIDISAVAFATGYFVYRWTDSEGYRSDAISIPFPAVAEVTPFHLRAVQGDVPGLKLRFVSPVEYDSLPAPDDHTIYFVDKVGIIFNGVAYSTITGD